MLPGSPRISLPKHDALAAELKDLENNEGQRLLAMCITHRWRWALIARTLSAWALAASWIQGRKPPVSAGGAGRQTDPVLPGGLVGLLPPALPASRVLTP